MPCAGSSSRRRGRPAMDKSRHRARLTRPRRRARYPSRMRLSHLFFTTPARRPLRCRDAVPSPAAAGGLRPPARIGDLLAAATRLPCQQARRAGHPRGDGPDRLPGDGDAGRPSGRHLEGQRTLRRDRPRADPVQGSQRARDGPGVDPRGGRRAAAGRHRQVLASAADDGLSLPDQVAGRAARARRAHPRSRIRDEGRLQLRSRRGGPRRQLRGAARRIRPDLRAARTRDGRGRRPMSGSWAAAWPTSSWS